MQTSIEGFCPAQHCDTPSQTSLALITCPLATKRTYSHTPIYCTNRDDPGPPKTTRPSRIPPYSLKKSTVIPPSWMTRCYQSIFSYNSYMTLPLLFILSSSQRFSIFYSQSSQSSYSLIFIRDTHPRSTLLILSLTILLIHQKSLFIQLLGATNTLDSTYVDIHREDVAVFAQ